LAVEIDWQAAPRLLDDAAVAAAVEAALSYGGRGGLSVGVVLLDDPALCALHQRWFDDPSPTDVISFDLTSDGENDLDPGGPQAELYVSVDCARRTAGELGTDAARELALYLVHGALHLCGFDDGAPSERSRMRAAEAAVLGNLGYPQGPPVDG
jgi:probable rRNA maturation factor